MRAFAFSVFISALLLFMVEPLIGKALLPWFGGAPAVWTTCLLFFQVSLFGGYAYSHLVVRRLPSRLQVRVHLALVGIALVALVAQVATWSAPVLPGQGLRPPDSTWPILRLFAVLSLTVGLPFFTLSTTGPLAQAWFARAHPNASPYRLYALSNLGSFLALLSYPLVVEPALTLRQQSWSWAVAFGLFVAGTWAMTRQLRKAPAAALEAAPEAQAAPAPPVSRGTIAFWVLLAAVPSIALMAITNQLSQEVAVSPLMWVAPLALYLLTFILTFESTRWYVRRRFVIALLVLLPVAFVVSARQHLLPVWVQVVGLLGVMFAIGMLCHGELSNRRPHVGSLTTFYLAVSGGGAIGALFVPLVAPVLFTNYYELDVGFTLTWLVVIATLLTDRTSAFWGKRWRLARAGAAVFLTALLFLSLLRVVAWDQGSLAVRRNFYGVLKVSRECEKAPAPVPECAMTQTHGRTLHGLQLQDEARKHQATTYFTRRSGVGRVLTNELARAGGPLNIGVVGLGVGTLAAYTQPGDRLRFYEINPAVVELAEPGSPYFSYLADSKGEVDVVLGDARLSMERELLDGSRKYDVLVVDAFSSDAIPTHLLTREALELYRQHLAGPKSILALHISNRNLNLAPLVWSLAELTGYACKAVFTTAPDAPTGRFQVETSAMWMLLAVDPTALDAPAIVLDGADLEARGPPVRPWTDDFSNILSVME